MAIFVAFWWVIRLQALYRRLLNAHFLTEAAACIEFLFLGAVDE